MAAFPTLRKPRRGPSPPHRPSRYPPLVPAAEIDDYLATLDDTKRATLEQLRQDILSFIGDAEQGLSYGVPAFRLGGKVVAGFSAAARHLSYLPHSGSVLASMSPTDLEDYEWSKGALKIAVDRPLPRRLVGKLIAARRAEAGV